LKSFAHVLHCGIAAAGFAILSTSASAALVTIDKLPASTKVSAAGLNLNQTSDVQELYQRLSAAARQVCGPHAINGSPYDSAGFSQCYSDTLAQSVAKVNSPALLAYHQKQTSSPIAVATK
jgi:UrcA family protein